MISVDDISDLPRRVELPPPILIYLAGPLDDPDLQPDALQWREALQIERHDVAFVSPQHAFLRVSMQSAEAVILGNRAMIYASDGLLASLDGGFPFGTIREIEYARALEKPVAVFTERPQVSLSSYDVMWFHRPLDALEELLAQIQWTRNHAAALTRPQMYIERSEQS